MSRHASGPPPAGRKRGASGLAIAVVVLVLVVIAGAVIFGVKTLTGDKSGGDYPGPGTGSIAVVVANGDSASVIAQTLVGSGVVKSTSAFVAAANANPKSRSIAPGTYKLKRQMSGDGALTLMLDPASRQDVVTVPEGTRMVDALALIAKRTRLTLPALTKAAENPSTLGLPAYGRSAETPEGFLFPAQYSVKPDESAEEFLRSMVARYTSTTEGMKLATRARAAGRDPYDVLIVASIIQDEVSPADYAKAVRVIDNRLKIGMKLQLDSTLNYGLGRKTVAVSIADTRKPGPYNTYLNKGLPPTPINSPGEAAIEAALNPAKGDWLYWVTTDLESGLTKFATTYDEFLEYKAEFDASQQ